MCAAPTTWCAGVAWLRRSCCMCLNLLCSEPCMVHAAQRIVRTGGPVDDDMATLIKAQLQHVP